MSDRTRRAADQAAAAIRELNQLTRGEDQLEYPSDVYEILGSLRVMADRLPQLHAHLASWLMKAGNAGWVGYEGGDNAMDAIEQVNSGLSIATAAAREMAAGLAEAHNSAAGLTSAR